ncbi:MAG TPA: ABC transporter ATP-binding protein [Treponema sp.]|nr:ABC transporter ATP-binding protein [Treponema sp.]HBB42043.1 ABC transporter ATP-binding protein [Treponema sp.]HCA20311.1 ABC transporter ATP-binding protein [Treponema sp.]
MSFLECKNLFYKFDEFSINISFSAEENTLTSIVGPSGSGKSTILKIISGLLPLQKNTAVKTDIRLADSIILSTPPGKRNIGMVFQSPSLFLNMSVEDNVAYGLRCRGIRKKESRLMAQEFLKKVQLENFSKRSPETLSGGEAQRVALARTLIVQPKLVLLDEPLSALDAPLRKKMAAEIRSLQQSIPFTAIMVTHDIDEAKSISDRIIAIEKGEKKWEGPAKDYKL